MDTQRGVRPWSRRRFLGALGTLGGAVLAAACGRPSAPAPAKPAETQSSAPAAAKPAEAAKPDEAAKPAAPEPKVVSGVFNVWFSANGNTAQATSRSREIGPLNRVRGAGSSIVGSELSIAFTAC